MFSALRVGCQEGPLRNLRKHGVSFEEASSIFFDPLSVTGVDPDHSLSERRFVTSGKSCSGRVLVVAHADEPDTIRIITARRTTRQKESFMKKAKKVATDKLRSEYKRTDFGRLVRGKYSARLEKEFERLCLLFTRSLPMYFRTRLRSTQHCARWRRSPSAPDHLGDENHDPRIVRYNPLRRSIGR